MPASQRFRRAVEMCLFQSISTAKIGFEQLVEIAPGEAGERDQRDAAQLRQQALAFLAQLGEAGLLVLDQIPFVERDDHGAAFALDEVGQRQILLFEGDGGVEHQDDDLGVLDGAQAVADGELFELFGDAGRGGGCRRCRLD
jgi:hypothetical protein